MAGERILIVEDERAVARGLEYGLRKEGFEVLWAETGRQALDLVRTREPQLILLDVRLPDISGFDVCRELRAEGRHQPILMLTARDEELDKVLGLELGADDYVVKPYSLRELVSRIRALLRRSRNGENDEQYQVAELSLDASSRRVFLRGEQVTMGPTEFRLLQFFMSHPERAYTRSQLLDQVWGANVYVEERTVDVHIRRLRKALQADACDYSNLIQTVRGTGYRFSARGH